MVTWEIKEEEVQFVQTTIYVFVFTLDDEADPTDGKIVFRKPSKRPSGEKYSALTASSSKKKKETKMIPAPSQNTTKQVKNSSLLSFDEEESDDQVKKIKLGA